MNQCEINNQFNIITSSQSTLLINKLEQNANRKCLFNSRCILVVVEDRIIFSLWKNVEI